MKSYKVLPKTTTPSSGLCSPALLALLLAIFSSTPPAAAQQQQRQQQPSFAVNSQSNPLKDYAVPFNRESHPFFVDIDGDGDLDCFSGEYANSQLSALYFYRNEGTPKAPLFKAVTGQANPLASAAANRLSIPFFTDIDGDGDYDCFIGEGTTGAVMYYKNTGTSTHPLFEKQSAAFNPLSMVKFYVSEVANPAFADVDGDGDQDCLVADEAGELHYFRNTGSATRPVFVHVEEADNPFRALAAGGSVYNLSFEDWNKDGRMDVFINTTYYKNTGTARRPKFSSPADAADGPVMENTAANQYTYTPLQWVDLNGDGRVEVVQGTAKGSFTYQTLSTAADEGGGSGSRVMVKVTPNPSKYSFTLSITPGSAPSLIRLTDVGGKVLATRISTSSTVQLGSDLQPGVYIVQVMQNNKVIYNQKIIKE